MKLGTGVPYKMLSSQLEFPENRLSEVHNIHSIKTDFYPHNICWPTGVKTGTRNLHIMLFKIDEFREHRRGIQVTVHCHKFL